MPALLPQVRNFVAFNKGLTFRTALRTLLEIGYQARAHADALCTATLRCPPVLT
jgi:hypothetical protein